MDLPTGHPQLSVSLPTCMSSTSRTTEGPWKVREGPVSVSSHGGQSQLLDAFQVVSCASGGVGMNNGISNNVEQEQEQSSSTTASSSSSKQQHESSFPILPSSSSLFELKTTTTATGTNAQVVSFSAPHPPESSTLVRVDRAELVTINNKNCGTASDLLSPSSSSSSHFPTSFHVDHQPARGNANHAYNAVFLVDGLHKGIRIDQSDQQLHTPGPLLSPSAAANTTTTTCNCNQEHLNSSPSVPQPASSFGLPPPPPVLPARTTTTTTNSETEATCIRINSQQQQQQPEKNNSSVLQLKSIVPQNELRVIVPPNNSSASPQIQTRVLLPVPSARAPTTTTVVRTNSEPSSPCEDSIRTLISTEAQTDATDLPAATNTSVRDNAPQQTSRTSREHRKRERRERHLRRSQAAAGASQVGNNNANNNNASASQSSSSRRTRELDVTTTEEQLLADNASDSLPDLLNSHQPPPPYSTLPQNLDRRFQGIPHPQTVPMAVPIMSMPTVLTGTAAAHMQIPLQLPLAPPPPPPPPAVLLPQPTSCLQTATQAPAIRYHFSPTIRANRGSMRGPRSGGYTSEDEPKTCCGMTTSQTVSIRWFIVIIAVIGICCTVVGTTLGAAYSNGREHLTLSLLMIGVGVVLLTVSAVAWRLTSHDMENSCPSLLGFTRNRSGRGDGGTEPNRRFVPRLAPSYGRPHHPYAAMMYPEFQYRPPPPSYQASMQEYRLRLLLLERSNPTIAAAATLASTSALAMAPPPPAYRPYTGTLRPAVSRGNEVDLSRPPSYRSRSSGNNGQENSLCVRTSLDPSAGHHRHHHHHHHLHHVMLESPLHSRNPSLLSYLSQQSIGDNVSVVSGHGTPSNGTVVTVMQAVSVGMDLGLDMDMYDPEGVHHHHDDDDSKGLPEVMTDELAEEKGDGSRCNKDGNLVRIVQTTDSSQVIGRDSVIVTVSGSNQTLWDQSLQQANNQHNQTLAIHHHQPSPTIMAIHGTLAPSADVTQDLEQQHQTAPSQVQILAHL